MAGSSGQHVVVVGLGYVGLPLVVEAARSGLRTTGLDTSARVVAALNDARSHVDDVSDHDLVEARANGFRASTDPAVLDDADVVVICVPTPLDQHQAPDLRAVFAAADTIAAHLRPGMLVVLESTTYPGTTDGPLRDRLEVGGLKAGHDFALAFSPERIDPGNPHFALRNTPKVVGGLTPRCTERAVAFYSAIVDRVVPTTGPREAEMAKLLENIYRHVNIALVNEMAVFSHQLGVDLWEAINAAATKPFGFAAFYPGPGVGGHCIPIDPNYLSHQVRTLGYPFRFVELAQEISGRMPAYVTTRLQAVLNDAGKPVRGSTVVVLGLTYKADIADERETPARPLIRNLLALGANVIGVDPHLRSFVVDHTDLAVVHDLDELPAVLEASDVAVLVQRHSAFDLDMIAAHAPAVLDTRGVMRGPQVTRL